jgi:VIT1/CCC1 family predicted Fe2+/Mn2+ transporter
MKIFSLNSGKDGREEYVSQNIISNIKVLESVINDKIEKSKFKVLISSPLQKEIKGSFSSVMKEILSYNLVYGRCEYTIEELEYDND